MPIVFHGRQIAETVPFTPNGSIAADDVQEAIQEVRDEAAAAVITDHGALTGLGDDDHTAYATNAELTAHEGAADPHTGYVKENDANWIDLTDTGQTALHSHAGGGVTDADYLVGTAHAGLSAEIVVPAAVLTVLDDVTVAAMVDTLGGAASTGTGGLVRATSPTLVTPALGTPASGVMTNVTGLTEAGQTLADNTTNNVSTTRHGYVPKAPNVATQFLDGTGAFSTPAGGAGAVTREGGNLTEATTTSTTSVDLLTASGLTIAATEPFYAVGGFRKTNVHASNASAGWRINATVMESNTVATGTDANADSASIEIWAPPRLTLYRDGGNVRIFNRYSGTTFDNTTSGQWPTVAITDVIITAQVTNATNTAGADELNVYSYANA